MRRLFRINPINETDELRVQYEQQIQTNELRIACNMIPLFTVALSAS